MKYLGIGACVVGIMFVGVIWGAWVLVHLWGWFIVPVFGATALTLAQAAGLSLMVHYLVDRRETGSQKTITEQLIEGLTKVVSAPLFVLAVGYAIHLWSVQ